MAEPTPAAAASVEPAPSGRLWPALVMVLGLVAIGATLGLFSYRAYVQSEIFLRGVYEEASVYGARADAEGCVAWVLAEQKRCTAMASLCQGSIPGLTERCLAAADRGDYCRAMPNDVDTHWSHDRCAAKGYDRRNRACAVAYLSLATHCREHGRGVL